MRSRGSVEGKDFFSKGSLSPVLRLHGRSLPRLCGAADQRPLFARKTTSVDGVGKSIALIQISDSLLLRMRAGLRCWTSVPIFPCAMIRMVSESLQRTTLPGGRPGASSRDTHAGLLGYLRRDEPGGRYLPVPGRAVPGWNVEECGGLQLWTDPDDYPGAASGADCEARLLARPVPPWLAERGMRPFAPVYFGQAPVPFIYRDGIGSPSTNSCSIQ